MRQSISNDMSTDRVDACARKQLMQLMASLLVMLIVASVYSRNKINAEDFALGKENFHASESYAGHPFTASSVSAVKALFGQKQKLCQESKVKRLMWLGNSQLHTINQYKSGQHLAPYWLRQQSIKPACFEPNGFSLPNANFQEYLALATYALNNAKFDAAIISLVFDDLREDGLRQDFSAIMVGNLLSQLSGSEVGKEIVSRFSRERMQENLGSKENSGLEGFVQEKFEDRLTQKFGDIFPIWAERPNLRVNLITDLYYFRNHILGIRPTTVRKLIPARYQRNMAALHATLKKLHANHVPIVLYIAPIRHDISIPYDAAEYEKWKVEMIEIAKNYDARLLNLEQLVPGNLWGSYIEDNVDFMHFQGQGHELLAKKLSPVVKQIVGEF